MLYLYGDPAYTHQFGIASAFKRPANRELSPEKRLYNANLSNVRIAIEQGFGNLATQWRLIPEGRARSGYSPVGAYFVVAAFFTNCLNCPKPNINSQRFEIDLPELEEYVASMLKSNNIEEIEQAQQAIQLDPDLEPPTEDVQVESIEVCDGE